MSQHDLTARHASVDTVSRIYMNLHRIPDTELWNGTPPAKPLPVEGGEARNLRTVDFKHDPTNVTLTGNVRVTVVDEATA